MSELKAPQFNVDLSKLEKTFICVGPVCLRSGVGVGLGVGCGVGLGAGWAAYTLEPGASGTFMGFNLYSFVSRLPGGYVILDVIKNVQKQFPGAKTGAGCGVGLGYGVGIGLQYGPARSMAGGSSPFQNPSMNPQQGGFQPSSQQMGPSTPAQGPVPLPPSTTRSDELERLEKVEKRLDEIDQRLNLQFRLEEIEKKLEKIKR